MAGNDSYVKSLLHFDGTDTSTTFTDSAAGGTHTWTAIADAQLDTAQKKFGTASGLFDGDLAAISTPYSSDFDFDDGNFTIDLWLRFGDATVDQNILGIRSSGAPVDAVLLEYYYSLGYFRFLAQVNGTVVASYTFAWTPSEDTWYHIAVVRDGSNFYIFLDGISQSLTVNTAIGTSSITPATHLSFYMGVRGDQGINYLNGWLDEVRVSKGIARWTSNFTPPAEQYTQISESPSESPSLSSSASPSLSPSASESPSSSPSLSPSSSLSPSTSPSVSPSLSPSGSPSLSLSGSPSGSPSVSFSGSPSESQSGSPSLSPSASLSPSLSPSVSPSISPSLSPSASLSPSWSPSESPSKSPSTSPSRSPSLSQSESPSRSPSKSPSRSPSMSRSASPSRSPSASPSLSPSELDVTDFEYGYWPREMLSSNFTSRDSSDWYLY